VRRNSVRDRGDACREGVSKRDRASVACLPDPGCEREERYILNAETQLLYSSDYPHQDFDLPTQICDLPFLSEKAKRNTLGETALRLFGLPVPARR